MSTYCTPAQFLLNQLAILNITLWMTYALRIPISPDDRPWPIFPTFVSSLIYFTGHYFFGTPADKRRLIRLVLNLFWSINSFLFIVWVIYDQRSFPWFIFPLFTLSLPLILYRMRFIHKEARQWPYVGKCITHQLISEMILKQRLH